MRNRRFVPDPARSILVDLSCFTIFKHKTGDGLLVVMKSIAVMGGGERGEGGFFYTLFGYW